MQTYQEFAAEWMRNNPTHRHGGTAALPPPGFITAVEQTKATNALIDAIKALEERVAELERAE